MNSLHQAAQEAVEALNIARTGLQWYRGMMPEYVDGSDGEADEEIQAALNALESALQQQEVPREPVALLRKLVDYHFRRRQGFMQQEYEADWNRAREIADAASPSTTQQQEAGNGPDAMEAHRANGLAWAVSCWQAEVMNRPLVNVHRRTLDDTWRQVIRYFGGDPDELLGPNHDTLHMRAQEERAWKPKDDAGGGKGADRG